MIICTKCLFIILSEIITLRDLINVVLTPSLEFNKFKRTLHINTGPTQIHCYLIYIDWCYDNLLMY